MDKEKDMNDLSSELLQFVMIESESEEEFVEDDPEYVDIETLPSESDQNTDSEDEDLCRNDLSRPGNDCDRFISRNGKIEWFKVPPKYNAVGMKSSEIDCSEFGVRPNARNVTTPFEVFSMFINDEVLNCIVTYTNIYIKRISKRYERCRDSKEVTKDEISAFIGLLLYTGIMKTSHSQLKDLWSQDGTGIDIFRMTMCFTRFQFIMRCLRFDNFEIRRITMKNDKLTPVKELMNLMLTNFKNIYQPGRKVSVYEHLIPFRGTFPFKQYNYEKPKKHGIKLTCFIDSSTSYFVSCQIHRKRSKTHQNQRDASCDIVSDLITDIKGSFRDVITTEPYTSINLALATKQDGLNFIGSLSIRDKNIPRVFRSTRKPVKNVAYGFTEELTLISYVPQKREVKLYLCNRLQDRIIDISSTKPSLINDIDESEKVIDDMRHNTLHFGVNRKTRRWPLLMFFHLLNMAALNSQVVVNENTGTNSTTKSEFIKQLSLSLIKRQLENRSDSGYLPKDLRKRIRLNVDLPVETALVRHVEGPSVGRCRICSRMRDKKSRTRCSACQHFVCKEHSIITCVKCSHSTET